MEIQLTIAVNFISFKDIDEEHAMYSKSDNKEIMIYDKAGEVIEELFEPLLDRYQIKLKTSIEESHFIFDCINSLNNKCDKIILNGSGLCIYSLDWIKNKKATKKSDK